MLNNKSTTCFASTGNTELVVSNDPDIPQRISVLRGKFEVQKGKFRIGLRARNRTALFLSYDGGKTYSPECKVFVECANEYFNTYDSYPDFYVDKEFEESQWIYFKIVMCHKMDVAGRRRFAEIGIGSIQEDGNVVVTSVHNARGEEYQIDPDFYPDDVFPKFLSQAYAIASPLKGTILERNYIQWGYLFNLENMCDDDNSNGIKTWPNFINDTNPFRVLIDLGSEISANTMTIFGIRDDNFQAKKFILYGGTDRNNLHIIANVDNAEVNDKNVFVKFELQNIRYYKLEVYDTYCTDGRVLLSLRYIEFSIQYQGRLVPIDNQTVTLYNEWETIHYPSANFGKIYKSISNIDKPSKALFKFSGTSFGINAYKSPDYGRFYVYVDGQKIGRIRLDEPISRVQCIYIVENLEDKEHEVLIEDISGLNLDSFIIIDDKYLPDEIFSVEELPPIKSDLNYAEDTQTPSPSPELINPELPTSERTENYISIIFECDIVSGNIVLNHDCSSDECSVKNNIWVKLTFENGQISLTEYLEGTIIEKNSVTSNAQDLINNFEYDGKTKELKYRIESTFITLNEQQTENNLICIKPPTESPKPTESATQSPSASQSPSPIATYSPEPIPDEIEFVQALGNYADDNYLNSRLIATSSFTCTTSGDLVNYPISNAFSASTSSFWVGNRPVTESFRPYVIFDFKQTFTLEALIYTSGYRSQTNSRIFDGFPFKLNIYASVNNGPFLLKYRFSGEPPTSKTWDKTLYEFQDRLVCDKLKIEFVNVTENDSFGLAKARHPSAQRIMLLEYIPPTQTPSPAATPEQSPDQTPSLDTDSDTNIIITPEPIESTDIIPIDVNRTESDINKRFESEITNSTNYVVKIEDTNFSSINYDKNGGAVYIVNSGLQCNKITFNDCTTNEAGGAVYIKNVNDQSNSIEFNDISFSNCTAKYGGALYVLSTSPKVPVKIENCKFEGNIATSNDISNSFQYGGNSIFLTIKRGLIKMNTFIDKSNNDCNTMCIYNSFDSNNLNLLNDDTDSNLITISECTFEMPQVSSCCIFYTGGVKGSSYEIQQCSFIGNLSTGAHFIDGEMISEDCPKLAIKKCKFTCNSNEGFDFDKNFVSVDLNDQTFNDSNDPASSNNKLTIIIAVAVAAAVVIVIIVIVVIVVIKKKRNNSSSQGMKMLETEVDDSNNFDI